MCEYYSCKKRNHITRSLRLCKTNIGEQMWSWNFVNKLDLCWRWYLHWNLVCVGTKNYTEVYLVLWIRWIIPTKFTMVYNNFVWRLLLDLLCGDPICLCIILSSTNKKQRNGLVVYILDYLTHNLIYVLLVCSILINDYNFFVDFSNRGVCR